MNKLQALALAGALVVGIAYTPLAYKQTVRHEASQKFVRAQRQTALIQTPEAQGSAVVVQRTNPDGKLRYFAFTAAHCVDSCKADEITVTIFLRVEARKAGFIALKARRIAIDLDRDVALLAFDSPPGFFEGAVFASDEPAQPGDPVYACGNFRGAAFDASASSGIVSQIGVDPAFDGWPWAVADQTTCPVFPGSSGGPMFNADGEVLGLVVGGLSPVLNVYVPVRAITAFAVERNFLWAVRGNNCPDDAALISAELPPAPETVEVPQ